MADKKGNRMMQWFDRQALPEALHDEIAGVHAACKDFAEEMDTLPECAEKTAGMRKLVEAKDCFVRALIETGG